jgi:protein MpaA
MPRVFRIGRYTEILRRLDAIGRREGVMLSVLDELRRSGYALPFCMVRLGPATGPQLCISAGLHGDEPAGVEALVAFLERPALPNIGITAFPCVNPTGFVAGTRTNDIGLDLNRTFGQERGPQETELVRWALEGQRFACGIDLHEDHEANGFYLYEHVRDTPGVCSRIVAAIRAVGLPISDAASVEDRALVDGCVTPAEERLSPLVGFFSIYLFDRHGDHTLVPESTPILPMPARVAMHHAALDTVISTLRS